MKSDATSPLSPSSSYSSSPSLPPSPPLLRLPSSYWNTQQLGDVVTTIFDRWEILPVPPPHLPPCPSSFGLPSGRQVVNTGVFLLSKSCETLVTPGGERISHFRLPLIAPSSGRVSIAAIDPEGDWCKFLRYFSLYLAPFS